MAPCASERMHASDCCLCSAVPRGHGGQGPRPTSSAPASDFRAVQGRVAFVGSSVTHGVTWALLPRALTVGQGRAGHCPSGGERCALSFRMLTRHPPSRSEAQTSRRLEFAGAGLGHGSEQSEVAHAGIRLGPWPLKHCVPSDSAKGAPESLSFVPVHVQQRNPRSLPGCSKNIQTKISRFLLPRRSIWGPRVWCY